MLLVALLVQGNSTDKKNVMLVLETLLVQWQRNAKDPTFLQHSAHCDMLVAGAIAPLMSLMQHGEEAEMSDACALVSDLIRSDDAGLRKDAFIAAGAVGPLGEILTRADTRSKRAHANAASAFAILAAGTDGGCSSRKDTLIAAGIIAPLVVLLSHGDEHKAHFHHAKHKATCALVELGLGDDHRKDVIMTVGVVPPLVRLISDGDVYCQASAARALSMLAFGYDDFTRTHEMQQREEVRPQGATPSPCQQRKHLIVAAGAVLPLVALLQNGIENAQLCAAATLSCLVNDANEERKNAVVAAGAVVPLANLLLCGTTPEAKSNATCALAGLATRVKGNDMMAGSRKDAIIGAGAVVPLVALMTDESYGLLVANCRQSASSMGQPHPGIALMRLIGGKDGNRDKRLHAVAQALPGCDDHTDRSTTRGVIEELAGCTFSAGEVDPASGCCVVA